MSGAGPAVERYRRLELLGEGGAGQVWLVEDRYRPGSRIALKLAAGAERRDDALRREFATLSRLRHPGLVEVYDLDRSPDGATRFTLEYVDGDELPVAVARRGAPFLLEMTAEALRVLAFLHDFGLLHRDLKPPHLRVRRQPRLGCRLVLLDLSLALRDEDAADTKSPGPAGTLPYMAPELFEGAAPDRRTDLYSLGALLHEVVYGSPPVALQDGDLNAFVERLRSGERQRGPLAPDYPAGFAGWLDDLLASDPGRRPAGAAEALARLNASCDTSHPFHTAASRAARLASDPPAGRLDEARRLWSLLAPREGPRVIWLLGPAGSGKSRLLHWLRTEAILHGWDVVVPPLAPAAAAELERPPARGSDPIDALRGEAAARPTLLLLDELEAWDGAVGWLDRVARDGGAPPLQVVAAMRPGEIKDDRLRRLVEDTGTVPTLRRLDLGSIDSEAVRAMAERATASRDLSEARLRWLTRAAEGNALLAETLLVEGVWEKGGHSHGSGILERSVRARLSLLSPDATAWLETLAVVGRDATEEVVASLAGLDPATAREAAEESRAAGLCAIERGSWSMSRSVAEQVRRGLDPRRHRELHRSAAELLERSDRSERRPIRLARLWSACGESERARAHAAEAAERAERAGDPDAAARHLAVALRHAPRTDPGRLELRVRQGHALAAAGRHQAAARAWGAARRLCKTPARRPELLTRQAEALARAGRFSRARAVAERALQLARSRDDAAQEAAALKVVGMVLGRLGMESEALELLEQALELLSEQHDVRGEAETLQILAACKSRLQGVDAEADFLRSIELFRGLCEPGSELKSLIGLAVLRIRDGRLDEAEKLLEDVRARAVEHGNLDLQETALSKLASLALERGAVDRALSLSREALDQACHLGDRNRMMIDRCRVAESLVESGRPAEAVQLLREGMQTGLDTIEPDSLDYGRMVLALALLETPTADESDVRVLLERCQDGFRRRRKTRPLLLALVLDMETRARPGRPEPFEPVRLEFEALAGRAGAELEPEIVVRARIAHARFRLGRGDAGSAAEEAAAAARLCREPARPALAARAAGLMGEALEQKGEAVAASDAFVQAAAALERAADAIADEDVRRSFLDRPVFRTVRERTASQGSAGDRRLLALYEMIRALNSETDPEVLLESILDMALRAASADRGMVLLSRPDGEGFSVRLVRNLERETAEDAERYSRGIVARAGEGRSILALDAGEDERFRDLKSVSMFGIRSLMCVPLRSRGTVVGTVYLDSQREGHLFTRDDLRFIEAFADHAALALANARERERLRDENRRLQDLAETRFRCGNLVGRSAAMQEVFRLVAQVATSELPVLIQGESGTGKELVARAVHFNGARKRRVFLSENCAAIPESLLESELFGHVKGAFTGAERDRQGLFEQADGGTLFLDEVGDMSAAMQARLLRALQEGEIRRVGAERSVRVDVRVLAATHRDLEREVAEGRFREDLFYRLQVLVVRLPPLRDRPEDIPLLIDHLLERIARERGQPPPRVDPAVVSLLERYEWPGNVRQLENALQRLSLLAGSGPIREDLLAGDSTFDSLRRSDDPEPAFSFERGVTDQLRRALAAAGGNRAQAAKLLGVSRATIYRKLKQHGLS
jgi:transcriptional regulator with GAF, ATPase, and Fis domain